MPPLPPVTQFLMLLCTAVFFLGWIIPPGWMLWLTLWSLNSGRFMPWQMVTYAFVHDNFVQLLFNMLALWMFGSELELLWGPRRYLQYIAACIVAGAAAFLLLATLTGSFGVDRDISSAIYGLLLASAMLFPQRTVMPIVPPIPMKMKTFVLVFGAIALFFGLRAGSVVLPLAQLAGMIGGFLMIQYWRGKPPFGGGGGRRGPRRVH